MKKGLLTIAAGLLITVGATAQYNPDLWIVEDGTQNVESLTGLTPSNGYSLDRVGGDDATYTRSFDGEALKVEFENVAAAGEQYNDFQIGWYQWEKDIAAKFTTDTSGVAQEHDVIKGFSVDFTESANREITMEVKADAELTLRADLVDIAGKLSNEASPKTTIAGDGVYTTITYSWGGDPTAVSVDKIIDTYTGSWWGVELMYTENANPALRGGSNNPVPMDTAHIVALSLTIDDAADGAPGEEKVLWIKNVQIGAAASPTEYSPWVGIKTVEGAELEVNEGVVSSEGTITVMTVTGQVVATAEGQLDLSTVPAGVYVIVTPEGTAKIVK